RSSPRRSSDASMAGPGLRSAESGYRWSYVCSSRCGLFCVCRFSNNATKLACVHCREARMRTLRSEITKHGLSRTPHRAFMRAMGLDDAAIAKPMVGVVSMKGEHTPRNMTHRFQLDAAKGRLPE